VGYLAGWVSWGRVSLLAYRTHSSCIDKGSIRSPQQIAQRLDGIIADLRRRFHEHAIGKPKGSVETPYDVLIVAHGHILRAFAARWIGRDIADNPALILEAGGVGTLSYEHASLHEPAICKCKGRVLIIGDVVSTRHCCRIPG